MKDSGWYDPKETKVFLKDFSLFLSMDLTSFFIVFLDPVFVRTQLCEMDDRRSILSGINLTSKEK